jgi:hypothetical protein
VYTVERREQGNMKLLHEEYLGLDQLLDELSTLEAIETAYAYFEEKDEDAFGIGTSSDPDSDSSFNITSRFFARKEGSI